MTSKPGLVRCSWAKNDLAIHYHDVEWGVPQHDDRKLFEFLVLEGAQAAARAAAEESRDCAQPPEDRIGGQEREGILAGPGRVWQLRCLHLAVCWRQASAQLLSPAERCSRQDPRIGRNEQGSEEARVHVRRLDDLLRLHAGGGNGERSHGGVLPQGSGLAARFWLADRVFPFPEPKDPGQRCAGRREGCIRL